jgi:hypothetical protein
MVFARFKSTAPGVGQGRKIDEHSRE